MKFNYQFGEADLILQWGTLSPETWEYWFVLDGDNVLVVHTTGEVWQGEVRLTDRKSALDGLVQLIWDDKDWTIRKDSLTGKGKKLYDDYLDAKRDAVLITLKDVTGIARRHGVDLYGCGWIEFEVDYFADQEAGECVICGARTEEGWLCLDGGDEVCHHHIEIES